MAAPHSIEREKRALRARMRALPRATAAEETALRGAVLSRAIRDKVRRIAAFIPFEDEPDLRPTFPALEAQGARILLPVIVARDTPLLFRPWAGGRSLVGGLLGTRHPAEGPDEDPDLALVPLLAFDRAGRRLGRGAGFYDRTLAARPACRAIGVAFACQEVDLVPSGPYDVRLDAVATEHGVITTAPPGR